VIGVFGFVGIGADSSRVSLEAMAGGAPCDVDCGPAHAIGATRSATPATLLARDGLVVALHGHPFWENERGRTTTLSAVAARLLDAYRSEGKQVLQRLHGDYGVALLQPESGHALLAVDRMSIRNLVYTATPRGGLAFGPTCDALARCPGLTLDVDPQGIFNYLYFHAIPGPATAFRGVRRVPPGHAVDFTDGRTTVIRHWRPRFVENSRRDFDPLKREFRAAMEDGVRASLDGDRCGAFLSGGTDSSTIAGMLGKVSGAPAATFSIGFHAPGYDEMVYARTAARHFGTRQHEYYVTADDVVDAIPRIAATYDQPFGNASAIPTYYCAKLASTSGITRMLGGDGGDELYGGNARYARQAQFARYESIPRPLRHWLVEPLARSLPLTARVALLRKARSYVAQASQPMPDRYESYNLLERLGLDNVCAPEFLASVDPGAPRARLREVWADVDAESLINRMLALDFQFTLADNDLPKVTRMCELAGVDVTFPMLHDPVIDFSLALPPDHKLRGATLRWFFKEALKDFLPPEIIAKQKHGFGLPVGVWLQEHRALHELAGDSLTGLARRGIVRREFLRRLVDEQLREHGAYYGTMVWILMMLELWFKAREGAGSGPA
jgi:asparagine synthase (glutamine-hydrolysing)